MRRCLRHLVVARDRFYINFVDNYNSLIFIRVKYSVRINDFRLIYLIYILFIVRKYIWLWHILVVFETFFVDVTRIFMRILQHCLRSHALLFRLYSIMHLCITSLLLCCDCRLTTMTHIICIALNISSLYTIALAMLIRLIHGILPLFTTSFVFILRLLKVTVITYLFIL